MPNLLAFVLSLYLFVMTLEMIESRRGSSIIIIGGGGTGGHSVSEKIVPIPIPIPMPCPIQHSQQRQIKVPIIMRVP